MGCLFQIVNEVGNSESSNSDHVLHVQAISQELGALGHEADHLKLIRRRQQILYVVRIYDHITSVCPFC